MGLNWRLMMASAMVPAVVVCALIGMCPESPRWYLSKGRDAKAYEAAKSLRWEPVQAARDIFYMQAGLKVQRDAEKLGKGNRLKEVSTVRRNRNAFLASQTVMFMQQFCGVNVSDTCYTFC